MHIDIDGSDFELQALRTKRAAQEFENRMPAIIRRAAMIVKREVQIRMPKKTGRAAASWGNVPAPFPAELGDGVWSVEDDGWTVIQGSNVEYVPALNEGHSTQAPAGFIDAEAVEGREVLEESINALIASLL
jgi:hypothetical protein